MKKIVLILVLTSFLLVAFFAILNNASVGKTVKLMVAKQPERVSEIYFTNYAVLPKKLKANHSYQVDFTTTNREYRHKSYAFRAIMIENDNSPKVIASNTFDLYNNQSSQQQIQFMPTRPNALIKITIELINSGHEIRFKAKTWPKKTKKQQEQ